MCLPRRLEQPATFSFTSQRSNVTYMLSTATASHAAAEAACRQRGGHLASYASLAEQADVEEVGGAGRARTS
jgi:hypothetical protein